MPASFVGEVYESRYSVLERGGGGRQGGLAGEDAVEVKKEVEGEAKTEDEDQALLSDFDDDYLALCARSYARKFRELERTLEPEGVYRDGVRGIVAAHLLELIAVKSFGAANAAGALRRAAGQERRLKV